MHRLNVTFFLPFFPPSPFSISRQIDRVFIETPAHVSACSANFSTEHRPDSAAETRVNIKKPFDSADNKHHARILIFNIAPEFQIQPSPVHPPSPSFRTSYLTYPRSHVLYFSIQGYYTLYTIILLLFFSLEEETTTLNSNRNSDCDQSDPPPLQIFRRRFGGTIKLTSAKCVSDLLCGRIYLHHCFPPGNPPPPLVCFALLHAPFEPRYTYTTRSLVYGSRVCHTIESSSKGRVFISLSLSFLCPSSKEEKEKGRV